MRQATLSSKSPVAVEHRRKNMELRRPTVGEAKERLSYLQDLHTICAGVLRRSSDAIFGPAPSSMIQTCTTTQGSCNRLAQDGSFAATVFALLDHDLVVLERELFCQLRIHQLLLRQRVHGGKHSFGTCRAVDHEHAHAAFRRHLMRHAGWNVNARSFLRVKQFIADLEIRAAVENV